MLNRSIVSIAVGKEYYLKLSTNLIRSFLNWNRDIHFLLLTDNISYFEEFSNHQMVTIHHMEISEVEKSFTAKFELWNYAMAEENLFIDCDCLIYGNLNFVFDMMRGQHFTAIGENSTDGHFFCNVAEIIKKLHLTSLPKFVGSVYFFKKSAIAKNIFDKAIELKGRYDELGFIRLRGKKNEEPLLAVAMAMYGQQPIEDDGTIKADRMFYENCAANVRNGRTLLTNLKAPINPEYCNLLKSSPVIIHYNDSFSEKAEYLAEQYRLQNYQKHPIVLAMLTSLVFFLPEAVNLSLKSLFRPLYYRICGPSKLKVNKRVK